VGPPKLPLAARGVPPRVHPVVFEAAHRAAQRYRLGCHRGFPRRHHLPRPGEQTRAQDSHPCERTDGRRHQVRLGSRGGRSHLPKGQAASGRAEDRRPPRRLPSGARRRRPKTSRKRSATPPTRISSLRPSTGTLRNLLEGPTRSTRCSRSRAPITRGPSSTPSKNVSCFDATSIRPGPQRKMARALTTTRKRVARKRGSQKSITAS
jgi:hypothetical protein